MSYSYTGADELLAIVGVDRYAAAAEIAGDYAEFFEEIGDPVRAEVFRRDAATLRAAADASADRDEDGDG